jgi:hypothetical protein
LPRQGVIALVFQRFNASDQVCNGPGGTNALHHAGNLAPVLGIAAEPGAAFTSDHLAARIPCPVSSGIG